MGWRICNGVVCSGIRKEKTGSRQDGQELARIYCTSCERQFDDILVGVFETQQGARSADFVLLYEEEEYAFQFRRFLTRRWIMSNPNP